MGPVLAAADDGEGGVSGMGIAPLIPGTAGTEGVGGSETPPVVDPIEVISSY